ncbi:nuclease domain-containing protein [Marinobacter sp. X15-166B]|uniref:nuclease domain-containing protein n=1 Tax=Marinobacter sp. X15-166B TaxID=1897620 RepID=UPI00085C8C26|nr:nuclease domain-containing protein [Marinobacter sp. X15-166B]OEY68011.1 hypothetical protein BG841_10350 [Marinobacter sp. X15-166B]
MRATRPKSSRIRQSARGMECQVRVPGVCNRDPDTVVLAHLNGAGVGMKNPDWQAAYACSACHSWLDGGYTQTVTRHYRDLLHLEGVIRSQPLMVDEGLIVIKGAA